MNQTLHAHALASAGSIIAAAGMLLLGIGANIGLYVGAAQMMQQGHMLFSFSLGGIVAGMIEAAVVSYISLYAFAWVYNKMLGRESGK